MRGLCSSLYGPACTNLWMNFLAVNKWPPCFQAKHQTLWLVGIANGTHREQVRWTRGMRMSSGDGDVAELIDKTLVKPGERSPKEAARQLTSTRREALSLYRLVLRTSRLFVWRNEHGVPWRDLIRESTRKEFEAARFETDPELVARLLVGGRDAVQAAMDKFLAKRAAMIREDEETAREMRPQ